MSGNVYEQAVKDMIREIQQRLDDAEQAMAALPQERVYVPPRLIQPIQDRVSRAYRAGQIAGLKELIQAMEILRDNGKEPL